MILQDENVDHVDSVEDVDDVAHFGLFRQNGGKEESSSAPHVFSFYHQFQSASI